MWVSSSVFMFISTSSSSPRLRLTLSGCGILHITRTFSGKPSECCCGDDLQGSNLLSPSLSRGAQRAARPRTSQLPRSSHLSAIFFSAISYTMCDPLLRHLIQDVVHFTLSRLLHAPLLGRVVFQVHRLRLLVVVVEEHIVVVGANPLPHEPIVRSYTYFGIFG